MLILFCSMFTMMASGGALDSIDLSAYQWKNRLLFLFATVELKDIFKIIDAMPMRQQEMRKK
jgi:hypothetical protein